MIEVELRKNKENKFVIAILGLCGECKAEELKNAVYYVGAGDKLPRMQCEALAFDDADEAFIKGDEVYNTILQDRVAEQARKAWRRHVAP